MNLDIEKKRLKKNIESLSKLELNEIFILLKKKKIEYTTNNNGIFINLKNFDKELITELENYILFCKNNKIFLDKNIENKNNLIKNYNKTNIDLIHNFEEYINLKNVSFIEKMTIKFKRKKKMENHMKFINIIKKYNRVLLNSTDSELNLNELNHEKYKCN